MIKKIFSRILVIILTFLLKLTKSLAFETIYKIRTFAYKFILKEMGKNCTICENVIIDRRIEERQMGDILSIVRRQD